MRSKRTPSRRPPSDRGDAAHTSNVLDLIGEWHAHRRKTGDSMNGVMSALLVQVDFDDVKPGALVEALRVLLAGLPAGARADVSHAADRERELLAECIGDTALGITTKQLTANMSPADRELVSVLEGLWANPKAFRAAVALIKALGGIPPVMTPEAFATAQAGS